MTKTIKLTKSSNSDQEKKTEMALLPISEVKKRASLKILREHFEEYYNDKFENICEMVINS